MKKFAFLSLILVLSSCEDMPRTRRGQCLSYDNRVIECSKASNNLSISDYRKKYIAEVTLQSAITNESITFLENASDADFDQEYRCDLDVSSQKKFKFQLTNGQLVLYDTFTTMTFKKPNGSTSDNLLGTWEMIEVQGKAQIITEFIVKEFEEIRIRKTCNLK